MSHLSNLYTNKMVQSAQCWIRVFSQALLSKQVSFAHQDKRLHSGDQILRIGDTDLAGMNSEQVAQVRRNFKL